MPPIMLFAGIDEAGYGPTLGPLAVVATRVHADSVAALRAAFATSGTGLADSKRVHRPGDLAPLERVALGGLAWLTGAPPRNAAEEFYGRMRGWIVPPATGAYVFWIAADDEGALFISPDDTFINVNGITSKAVHLILYIVF